MAAERPKLGLVLHSNLARRYAAHDREHPIGQAAQQIADNYAHAAELQAMHWGAIEAHLDTRGLY